VTFILGKVKVSPPPLFRDLSRIYADWLSLSTTLLSFDSIISQETDFFQFDPTNIMRRKNPIMHAGETMCVQYVHYIFEEKGSVCKLEEI
jgi:hypothetical protein